MMICDHVYVIRRWVMFSPHVEGEEGCVRCFSNTFMTFSTMLHTHLPKFHLNVNGQCRWQGSLIQDWFMGELCNSVTRFNLCSHRKYMSLWGEIVLQIPLFISHIQCFANEFEWRKVSVDSWATVPLVPLFLYELYIWLRPVFRLSVQINPILLLKKTSKPKCLMDPLMQVLLEAEILSVGPQGRATSQ